MKDRYYSLDGMRGFAAIVVILHHCGLQWDVGLARSGYLAVDFFFALSGFVVALAYHDRLKDGLSVRAFMRLRVVRLYPLYLAGLLLGLVKALGQSATHDGTALDMPTLLLSVAASVAMLPTPAPGLVSIFPLNTPAWSLFFEMVANVVFALLIVRLRTGAIAFLIGASAGWLLLGIATHDIGGQGLGTSWPDFAYGFPRVMFAFLLGVLFFRLARQGERRASRGSLVAVAALTAMLLVDPSPAWVRQYDMLVLGLGIPAVLWAGIAWEVPLPHRPFFAWLGDISYPLYILHFPLLMIYLFIARTLHLPDIVIAISFLSGMLALCTLIVRLYDEPARQRLAVWLRVPGSCRYRDRWRQQREKDYPAAAASRSTSRQPMSLRQNPVGKSIAATAA